VDFWVVSWVVLCRVGGGSLPAFLPGSRHPHRSRPLISDPFRSAEICSFLGFRFAVFTLVVWGYFGVSVLGYLCTVHVVFVCIVCSLFLFDHRLGDR
jgi:hypothetical protein